MNEVIAYKKYYKDKHLKFDSLILNCEYEIIY